MRYTIGISPIAEASAMLREWRPTHLLSLCAAHHLSVPRDVLRLDAYCEDVERQGAVNAPTTELVASVLSFGRGVPDSARLLVVCEAGVSRSGAAVLALLAQEVGVEEAELVISGIRPQAHPNLLITSYADQLLGLDRKLIAAGERVRQRADDFLADQLAGG